MGIAIHNLSTSGEGAGAEGSNDLAAAVRQAAAGILGTTVQLADLVSLLYLFCCRLDLCFVGMAICVVVLSTHASENGQDEFPRVVMG